MFRALGKAVSRFWPVLLVVWLALLAGSLYAPRWDTLVKSGEGEALPQNSPSRRADQLFRTAFPSDYAASSIVLVLSREEGELRDEDRRFIDHQLTPQVKAIADTQAGPEMVTRVRGPADQGVRTLLVSPDKMAALVVVELKTSLNDQRNWPLVAAVEDLVDRFRREGAVPDGLAVALTGGAVAGRDLDRAEAQSARVIEAWTVGIVIGLLLLLYHAPLVALIPLASVFVAARVSIELLSLLAEAEVLTLFRGVRVFVTVLIYGAGVDYCLFLIARYREELDGGAPPREALAQALARVGGAITASAGTVICGIGTLAFARLGKIHQAGLAIPIALAVALVCTLTFAGPLLRLAGRWAFWPLPTGPQPAEAGPPGVLRRFLARSFLPNVWDRLGPALLRRPGVILLGTAALMAPFAVYAVRHYGEQEYNPITELPDTAPGAAGTRALQRHFPAGILGPVTILVRNDAVDFGSESGVAAVGALTASLRDRKDELAIADVRSIARPLGITAAAQEFLRGLHAPESLVRSVMRQRAADYYVSRAGDLKGHVTRVDVTLAVDPLSGRGIAALSRVEEVVRSDLPAALRDSQLEFAGSTANLRDLGDVKRGDEMRVQVLASAVVFVLLVVVFRRLVVSAYLILTVLFSYLATLGATFAVFRLAVGPEFSGLDWKVPIFLFTILVAVGEDYNIFLLSRVKEEQKRYGPLHGVPVALGRTGYVISSCGLLMAGTFACLLSSPLLAMKELGFALACGVLVDTLVVRPILVPAFLVLLQNPLLGRVGQYMALYAGPRAQSRAA
ncbi:MAG: hypothetical protein JWO38_6210 [Gemmataceae bacterium]|nr:hypothetical protein [Gemmataceae bacterium]